MQVVAVKVKVSVHELAVVGIHDKGSLTDKQSVRVKEWGFASQLAVDYKIYLLILKERKGGKPRPKQRLPFLKALPQM